MRGFLRRLFEREMMLDARVRVMGLIAFTCWLFHFVRYAYVVGEPGQLFWLCHTSTLVLSFGLVFSWASWVRTGAVWALVGLPIWLIDVILRWETTRVSVLTHIVVPIVGVVGLTQVRMRGPVVALSMLLYLVSQGGARLFSLPASNVNLAHQMYDLFGTGLVDAYRVYWVILSTLLVGVLALVTWALKKKLPEAELAEIAPVEALIPEAPPEPPLFPELDEPGFRLAPKISPADLPRHRPVTAVPGSAPAPVPSRPAPAPAPAPAAARVAEPSTPQPRPEPSNPQPRPESSAPRSRGFNVVRAPPRGFTLLEMMLVVSILAIMAAIAVPDLTPAVHNAKLRASIDEVASFVERARRQARAEGRCYRITLSGNTLQMQPRLNADCTTPIGGALSAGGWGPVTDTLAAQGRFTFGLSSIPEALPDEIVFRPNGRVRGDGDLVVTEDGGQVTIAYAPLPTRFANVLVTSQGRVCPVLLSSLPGALTDAAPPVCGTGFGAGGSSGGGGGFSAGTGGGTGGGFGGCG